MANLDLDAFEPTGPSCTFTLGGREWHVRSADELPFEFLRSILADADGEDPKGVLGQLEAFFAQILVEDEVAEFQRLLADPHSPLTIGKIKPLVTFIGEQLMSTERPTTPPLPSRAGRRSTGATSGGVSSSLASHQSLSAG